MVRQSDAVKLLALGLLNYSDDEGYFYAEPKMVRAALRPLDEDSTIVRDLLARLLEMGYIETVHHHTHGDLGRIVSFTKHQRVDRASASRIKGLWGEKDSSNNRRIIVEHSPLEGKGREQGTGKGLIIAFETFWAAWPKKKARADAQKAFAKCGVPVETLVAAIEKQKQDEEWKKQGGKFIPYPATWLNGRRWEDGETAIADLPIATAEEIEAQRRHEEAQAEMFAEQAAELRRKLEAAQ